MQSIEITAKSVEDAKQQAAAKLGVSASDITVTVLEETKGLFGKSQVRARCEAKEAKAAPKAMPKEKTAIGRPPQQTKKDVQEAFDAPEAELAPEPVAEPKEEPQERKSRRIGRKESAPKAEPVAAATESEDVSEAASASEADAAKLLEILRDLLASANLQITAEVRDMTGKYVNIQLDGRDAAFLVGKHGEVLNATQYLLNIVAARKITAGVRATLDANDYRKRREDALTKLATKIAEQVLDRQEEAVLDALPAFERRIVHKALSTVSGIATYSEGEEPNRRVVIAPGE